jgi:hypothetical protein
MPRLAVLALFALALASLLFPSPAAAAGQTYYVATSGSDSNPGTLSEPFRTIDKGLVTLRAGDTLYIRGGTYTEQIGGVAFTMLSPGRADAPVLVSAFPGERPVLVGLLWLDGMDYWTFDGLNVTWSDSSTASDHMVRLRNGVGWRWQDSEIWGAKSYANLNILSSVSGEPSDWIVRRNCIHDNVGDPTHGDTRDQLMYVNTGESAGNGLISRNILFRAPRGKAIKLAGPDPGTGSNHVTVRYNTIADTTKPGIVVGYATSNSTLYRNLVVDTDDVSLIRGYELEGVNNVAYDNAGYGGPELLWSDPGYNEVADGGGNVFGIDPAFTTINACDGYHPATLSLREYGRWAPVLP